MSVQMLAEQTVTQDDYLESLEAMILHRLGGRVRDLRVQLRDSGIILQGRAATYHAKQLAQHAAMEVAGLPILANDIEVR